LINKINKSQDDQLLAALDNLLKDESRKEIYQLTEAQLKAIKNAKDQIQHGEFLTDAEVRKRTHQWLVSS